MRNSAEYLLLLMIPLGLLCAPYAWSHDHVLLLLPYALLIAKLHASRPRACVPLLALIGVLSWAAVGVSLRIGEQVMLLWPAVILLLCNCSQNIADPD